MGVSPTMAGLGSFVNGKKVWMSGGRGSGFKQAVAETLAWVCPFRPLKIAAANMPGRITPGLRTSTRTLAVRILRSRIALTLLIGPVVPHFG